jgi:hypothetical protein
MVPGAGVGETLASMHSNRMRWATALSFCAMMTASLPARPVDVVPMAGFRFGGSLSSSNDPTQSQNLSMDSAASYGGIVDIPLPAPYQPRAIELYFSRQHTTISGGDLLSPPAGNLDVTVFHVGLADTIQTEDPRLSWMLLATAGATRFDTTATRDTRPSVAIGGAVMWMFNPHVGLRGDLRAIVNFTGSNASVLACNGGCSYFYAGTIVAQGEASVGLVFRFK